MTLRRYIAIVEAMSRYVTTPPDWMASRERTPVGDVLFHGTPLTHLINIIKTNEISTGIDWRGEGDRVALTRSYRVAYSFGKQGEGTYYPTVLVLDWKKLASAYHVIPHNDPDPDGNPRERNEREEAVYGTIRPLSQYLVSVNVNPRFLRAAMKDEDFIGLCIEEHGWAKTPQAVQRMLMAVAQHPKLNAWRPA